MSVCIQTILELIKEPFSQAIPIIFGSRSSLFCELAIPYGVACDSREILKAFKISREQLTPF